MTSGADGVEDVDWLECRHCGGRLEHVRSVGPNSFFRCVSCGQEQAFLDVPAYEEFERSLGPLGTLKVLWRKEEPVASDALALRQLVPDFQNLSVPEVLKRIKGRWSHAVGAERLGRPGGEVHAVER